MKKEKIDIMEAKVQPHDTETEQAVLSSLIMYNENFARYADQLSVDLFYYEKERAIYRCIEGVINAGNVTDINSLFNYAESHDLGYQLFRSDFAETIKYLNKVALGQDIARLQDMHKRRKSWRLLQVAAQRVLDMTEDCDAVMENTLQMMSDVTDGRSGGEQNMSDVIDVMVTDIITRREEKGEIGIMTGLHIFDVRYGWHGGDFIVIAGETSMGKSTLATTIAYNTAVKGIPSAYYSLEMSAKQLTARIIAKDVKVMNRDILYGKLSDEEYNRFYDGTLALKKLPIYFDEESRTSFSKITGSIRRMVRKNGIKIAFIDYLQILANGTDDNREQFIGDMARDLKRLAVETDIVIVALSQLARQKGTTEPAISRMRGSGQIEEACDMAVLIHRPNRNNDEAVISIAKGRNIGTGKEKIKFCADYSYFSDYEEGDSQAPYQEQKAKLPF